MFIHTCVLILASLNTMGGVWGEKLPKPRLATSEPSTWKPVENKVSVPTGGVTLSETGLFSPVIKNNIRYLLGAFSVDHMLVPFRERAGKSNPAANDLHVFIPHLSLKGQTFCVFRVMQSSDAHR